MADLPDNPVDDDFEPTASIDPIPKSESVSAPEPPSTPQTMPAPDLATPPEGSHIPPIPIAEPTNHLEHVGLVKLRKPPMQPEPYRGTAFWRRIVAVLGLGAAAIAGGLVIAALIGAVLVGAAVLLESIIS